MSEKITISVTFEGEAKMMFEFGFARSGLTNRAEFLRSLVAQEFKRLGGNNEKLAD